MRVKSKYIKIITFIFPILLGIIIVIIKNSIYYKQDKDIIENDNNELIVLFNRKLEEQELSKLLDGFDNNAKITQHFGDYGLVSVDNKEIYQDLVKKLKKDPLVKVVQANGKVEAMQVTNDTYAANQWAIHNPGSYLLFSSNGNKEIFAKKDIDMDVAEAWRYLAAEKIGRRQVVVAIIDTGVDYTHPDLTKNIWINENEIAGDGIDNDNNGFVDDIYGWDFYNDDDSVCHYKYDSKSKSNLALPEDNDDHGTHIAGIIGAVADNGIGIAGIASKIDIKLMVLKINGGRDGTGSISDAILAIKYATMMGADICNISWGTDQNSPALKEVIKESDMLFVAAAGNQGLNNDHKPVYPASYKLDNLISVTFINAFGRLTRLSNYGKKSVDIAAPGSDILSTAVGSYKTLSGSSMAVPQVSAVAALLYSYNENIYPQRVKELLLKTIKPVSELKGSIRYPGIVSAYKALLSIRDLRKDKSVPTIKLSTLYDKGNLIIDVKAKDEGGAGVRVIRWLTGKRDIKDFSRGTKGQAVKNNQVKVSKAGVYSFYISDYAGNEFVRHYKVTDDKTSPIISAGFTVSGDYKTRTINIRVRDSQSGIKRVKYLSGKRQIEDFMPAASGKEIKLNNERGFFNVKKDGFYTIYAIDHRGNQRIKIIEVKTIKSEDVKFTRSEKTMTIGDTYILRAFVKPATTTDLITYNSSHKDIVSVDNKGKLKALKEGEAIITARTSNGFTAVCKIVVVAADP